MTYPVATGLVRKTVAVRGLEPHMYSEDEARALHATLERMARESVPLLGP